MGACQVKGIFDDLMVLVWCRSTVMMFDMVALGFVSLE